MNKTSLFWLAGLLVAGFITLMLLNHTPLPYISFSVIENEPAFASAQSTPPLRLAVSSILSPRDSIHHYRKIADCLAAEINTPVILIQRPTYSEVCSLLINGGADIAFLSTGTFTLYADHEEIEPLVMQQRQGSLYYEAYLIVPRGSAAKALTDLHGKTFAFCDPLSYSGYLAVVHALRQQNQTPEGFFGHYFYTYNHGKSLSAVANRVVDGAVIDSLVYHHAIQKNPEIADAIRVISVLGKAGTGPIVVRKNLDSERKRLIKHTLLSMHTNSQAQEALAGIMIERFVPFNASLFPVAPGVTAGGSL
ncbi:phosphate/phosphite/phosphonate ABC transporter substrate-binding protein [Sporomusa sp.]|uniref:substrate-binding domain-containing protein n=1 Tax=Sporomusa sp. TaxID=2078658 RepID=UPI002CEF25E1|nr:phosphate/phosphite/phosphonate ABC transporter substrate-binding protein [Sporomusa sp.]HWR43553.1 phosphate/phosphite/phosphonate ABC transporter substrate-binding protein [Sporomusa sp.]